MQRELRLGLNGLEQVAPAPFILLVGLVGGVLQSLGDFANGNAAAVLGALLILGIAAVVLWWVSVRRRRYSVWSTAVQLTIALALAQIVSFALVAPRIVPADVHIRWLDAFEQVLWVQLVLSPIRFAGGALLVAFGRLLPGSARRHGDSSPGASAEES